LKAFKDGPRRPVQLQFVARVAASFALAI